MADRKAELERRRKKLDELRKSREQKKTEAARNKVWLGDLAFMYPVSCLPNAGSYSWCHS